MRVPQPPPIARLRRSDPPGVLGGFILSQLKQYQEPSRKGTPRGEPVGLSKQKFHATLLGLTSLPLGAAAKKVGVSYGLLRKWRTESAFRSQVQTNISGFIDQAYNPMLFWLMLHAEDQWRTLRDFPVEQLARGDLPQLQLGGFADAGLYVTELLNEIAGRALQRRRDAGPKPASGLRSLLLVEHHLAFVFFPLSGIERNTIRKARREQWPALVRAAIELLSQAAEIRGIRPADDDAAERAALIEGLVEDRERAAILVLRRLERELGRS